MHHEVDLAPLLFERIEDGVDAGFVANVAMAGHEAVDLGEQRLDALLQCIALIGQRNFAALGMDRLGDPPCDRTVVRDAHDDATLALHQTRCLSHALSPILSAGIDDADARLHKIQKRQTGAVSARAANCRELPMA
ncbi:hypothetical protein D9M72_433570 [compost metagenome]